MLSERSFETLKYFFLAFASAVAIDSWYLVPYLIEEPVWGTGIPSFVLVSAAIFGFIYALGNNGPIAKWLPFLNFLYPFLAFFASLIGLVYMIFTAISVRDLFFWNYKGKVWPRCISALVGVATVAALAQAFQIAANPKLETTSFTKDEIAVNARLRREKLGGRALVLGPPFGLEVRDLPLEANRPSPEGQYTTISPFYLEVTRLYDNILKGHHRAAVGTIKRWNTNYVLITPSLRQVKDNRGRTFQQVLSVEGYTWIYGNPSFTLMRNTRPRAYVQEIRASTLIVGKFAPIIYGVFPNAVRAQKSEFIDDFKLADLPDFKTLVLYGFSFKNRGWAESLLRAYVEQGGRLIIDAQPIDEFALARNNRFLGVGIKSAAADRKKVLSGQGVFFGEAEAVTFPPKWRIVGYVGLDRDLLEIKNGNRRLAILGYKKIGSGRAHFTGGNLWYLAFGDQDPRLARLINKSIFSKTSEKSFKGTTANFEIRRFSPERFVFDFQSNRDFSALVSRTYSPHWRAELDGDRELDVNKTDGLMRLSLPAGRHQVIMSYEPTTVHAVSRALSFIAAAGFLFGFSRRHKWEQKRRPRPGGGHA